jgi:cobalt-zinc-cadmium efflux system protein
MSLHHHDHAHEPANYDRAFGWGIGLNAAYIVLEVVAGLAAGSLALLAMRGTT